MRNEPRSISPSRRPNQSHWSELNRRPLDYESSALPLSYSGDHGAEGSRTPDLCSAIAALSQLSYGPVGSRRLPSYQLSAIGYQSPAL